MYWNFLNNTFVTIAKESRPRAEKIADYTFAALEQRKLDAFYGPLYTAFKLVYDPMKAERANWQTQKGAQKGSTKSTDDLLLELSPGKINDWDLQISVVYKPGTPQYIALLPLGHRPFGTGKKDDRITAVKTLGQALTGIAALAATKLDVDNFYALLDAARTGQKGQISNTKDDSEELTDAMMNCMIGLYSVLGSCIARFAATPDDIKPIFDISTIRDVAQTTFISTVKKGIGTTEYIFKRSLDAGRFIRLTNMGTKAVAAFIADEKNDDPLQKVVTIQGGEEEIIDVNKLKASDTASFFKIQNTDNDVDGHVKIEILPEGSRGIVN